MGHSGNDPALAGRLRASAADADLAAATADYHGARSEAEVASAYVRVDAAYDRSQGARSLRTGALATAGAVYLLQLFDAALHYGRQPELRVGRPLAVPRWSLSGSDAGVAVRVSL